MKIAKIVSAILLTASISLVSCGVKDADIKTAVEAAAKTNTDLAGLTVDVKDGVATITGMCKDDACKANCEKAVAAIKGVKSVVNNCSVAPPPPPPAPVMTAADEALSKGMSDALKDLSTVKGEVKDGIITLTGEIKKDAVAKLMQTLNSLKPKKIENKMTVK
jgi:hyperosmotically inducible periplasmic protein